MKVKEDVAEAYKGSLSKKELFQEKAAKISEEEA